MKLDRFRGSQPRNGCLKKAMVTPNRDEFICGIKVLYDLALFNLSCNTGFTGREDLYGLHQIIQLELIVPPSDQILSIRSDRSVWFEHFDFVLRFRRSFIC